MYRKLVMQLANKSEGTIEAMEKRLTKRNAGPREKTEFEIMKESKITLFYLIRSYSVSSYSSVEKKIV